MSIVHLTRFPWSYQTRADPEFHFNVPLAKPILALQPIQPAARLLPHAHTLDSIRQNIQHRGLRLLHEPFHHLRVALLLRSRHCLL